MSLIHPGLLLGILLATIPVILHFLLRSKPKKLIFPALALLQRRKIQNSQRLKLRHIWLLLLRILIIVAIVLALTRPSLPPANYSFSTYELVMFCSIIVLAVLAYLGLMRHYQKQRISQQSLNTRRTFLRGGIGGAAFLLIALLVLWPYQRRVFAEISAPLPAVSENIPVTAIFLFDTSLSMDYRQENQSRLEQAQSIAEEHLSNLPAQSRVSILNSSSEDISPFQSDLTAVKSRLKSLKTSAWSLYLDDRLRTAINRQEDDFKRSQNERQSSGSQSAGSDQFVREIYIYTDLARTAWRSQPSQLIQQQLEKLKWLGIYVIDVGVTSPQNIGISHLDLSRESITLGNSVSIKAEITSTGITASDTFLELYTQNEKGQLIKRDQRPLSTLASPDDAPASENVTTGAKPGPQLEMSLPNVDQPVTQGELRITSSDPYLPDDVRYFTITARPPPKILIVSPDASSARLWNDALAPRPLVTLKKNRYQCEIAPLNQIETLPLEEYAAIYLINITSLPDSLWQQFTDYVKQGGGLGVLMGSDGDAPESTIVSFNSRQAQELLPVELLGSLKFIPPEFLDLEHNEHALFSYFQDLGGTGELSNMEVNRYWRVEPENPDQVIARYTDARHSPAIIERNLGRGKVVVLTTGIDAQGWSQLLYARWSYLAFADQLTRYLIRTIANRTNYLAGEVAIYQWPATATTPESFLLRTPDLKQLPIEIKQGAHQVSIPDTRVVGHYELIDNSSNVTRSSSGFSVNVNPAESNFRPISNQELDQILGAERYSMTRDMEGLKRTIRTGRLGVEIFPILVTLLLAVFCLEHFTANYFYEIDQPSEESTS
ncbi:VWA domain-containing protein [Gimesia chilikensis]|uniref:BatA domain-containing protein n=1 Tax=Gimesia chilikensis TaxID=2605989 RepID=UPI0011EE64C7|nr:BatA domain-containing protein [Gimesia chilikensis]KAA0132007.1 VWA domain-containing protein [Gimesia chilikensis]